MRRQLLQFPHSHYSEKVRWALAHKRLPFDTWDLTRGTHVWRLRRLGLPEPTVPVLREPDGTLIQDSTAILDHLERAYPSVPLGPADPLVQAEARALEETLDEGLGHHVRRFAYAVLIDEPEVLRFMFLQGKGRLAHASFPLLNRLMRPRMVRRLELGPHAADTSEAEILAVLDVLDERLQDGGFLVGGGFTRADLTAASFLAVLTWPPEHPFRFPPSSMIPARIQSFLDAIRDRPSFGWCLKMYSQYRHLPSE